MRRAPIIPVCLFIIGISCDRVFDPYPLKTEVFFHPKLNHEENQKMTKLLNGIEDSMKSNFNVKHMNWKNTWNDSAYLPSSNPRCWTQSRLYAELTDFCGNYNRKIWSLTFKGHLESEREYLTSLLIEDLTFREYGYLVDEIRADIEQSEDRDYHDFWILYIRKMLKIL